MNVFVYFISHHAHVVFFATLFLIAGILCVSLNIPLWFFGILIATCFIPFIVSFLPARIYEWKWLLLPLSFISGAFLYTYQINAHRAFQETYVNKPISLTGTVVALEKIPASRHRYHMLIETSQIHTQEGTAKAKHMIGLYLMRDPKVCVDDTICVKNITIKKIENSSYNMFLAKEKISATAFLDEPDIICIARPTYSLNRYLSFLRNNIFSTVQRSMNKETFALYSSIFLGNKTSVKQEMDYAKEPFKIWGISHYLARSGLHLLIFGMVWHFILGFAPILFFWKQLFLLLLIGSYAVLSWSSVSFNRALIMFLIAKFCLLHKIRLHYVHLICLATCIVLMFNPLQLFYLDFQLSFGLTFALAWFNHIETHKKAA